MVTESTCTVCGARQPLVAGLEAPAAAEAWTAALAVWGESVPGAAAVLARYLDWFATPDKAPQARTVVRVLHDLAARFAAGEVRAKGITRPAPVSAWIDGMRLIISGSTGATRPLSTNGYLAGIVWHRAGEAGARALAPAGPVPESAGGAVAAGASPGLDRAHWQAEVRALRAMLAGARTADAQESLRRQLQHAESRLAPAGVQDGSGS
jgi:hypothetical protein